MKGTIYLEDGVVYIKERDLDSKEPESANWSSTRR